MNNLIETIKYRGYDIEVCYDESPSSPDEWGNEDTFLVYDHRSFNVERRGFDPQDIYNHCQEVKRWFYDGYYVFPLYAYIHSGVALSLGRSGYPFSCPWDTSMKGFVLVQRQKGWSYTRANAKERALSLVETWNLYLSGQVYGYNSEVGGCWGFYGDEGMKDMIEEAKGGIDYEIESKRKQYYTQLKTWIRNHVPLEKRYTFELSN